jgi:DNA-binding transcriptional ArsR family regulator
MDSNGAIGLLGALANEHRLAAFRLLVQAGPEGLPAGDIADALGIAASSMSFHLSHLSRAGLILQRRDGRSLIYSADFERINALIGYLTENCCGGRSCAPAAKPQPRRKRA